MSGHLTIKNKLAIGFGAIIGIILILLGLAYNNSVRLEQANGWDKHTLEVMLEGERIASSMREVRIIVRNYLLTGNEADLTMLPRWEAALHDHIARATTLTADHPGRQSRFVKIAALADNWIRQYVEREIEERRHAGAATASADQAGQSPVLKQAARLTAEIVRLTDAAIADEARLLVERSEMAAQLQHTTFVLLSAGGAACVVLALTISLSLMRTLLTPLRHLTDAVHRIGAGDPSARAVIVARDELGEVSIEFNRMAQALQDNQASELQATTMLRTKVDALLSVVSRASAGDLSGRISVAGDDAIGQLGSGLAAMFNSLRVLIDKVQAAGIQVASSTVEISASARQQEATGIEQAQTSVEILSTTKEISANSGQLLQTMEDATQVADYTMRTTAAAQASLRKMDATMQHMVTATSSINAKLAALSEKASNINGVLVTITKVADQTNILSLNAAIEAEKAGDSGRGFSVVAREIRRLADQTAVSTWDIAQMLKDMQSAVASSVMGMDKFSDEIRRSVGEVHAVTDQLSVVIVQVQTLAPQFDLVLQGVQSQAIGAQQIAQTMSQLSDATQQSVASLKATSQAVQTLQLSAAELQASVANFEGAP